jgi:hypothetical protein
MENLVARRNQDGNVHLANEDKSLVCGTVAKTVKINHLCSLEQVVTCGKCRAKVGLKTIAGSFRARSSRGLDSSAWGANKGR